MSNKKQRNLDKRIEKEIRNQKAAARKKQLPWIFGSALVAIALIVGGFFMSTNYDDAQQANAAVQDYYKNKITPDQLETKIHNKEDVYAYFYQPSCAHCKISTPILMPLAEEMGKPVFPVNIERQQEPWDDYKIEGTPTLIHFKDGKEVDRIVGGTTQDVFRDFLQK
ncbi:thioredoxin family protein [Tumebacillus sp. DT12]|uniref:Thioredoxin family protein n=1 Tax=Tumebacillus lacus TaxID=2995335 RepID=A0ABT3WYN7_9BACL|nr:thioredoxin family protein [Tumebacillus lacus]MCX7569793.1 thioredoxin family protein [Tumebacillus lacus]